LTLFITAYNESAVIPEKMLNCLELDYPADKLKILWVIDGSTDHSHELLKQYPMVEIINSPLRKGKTAAVNHGMEYVKTPIVVFSDANCLLNAEALKIIAGQFYEPSIGCVSGEKRVAFNDDDTVSSKGEGAYWKYESLLKKLDYKFYSAVGAAGELFALRTDLFAPMEADTLLDDFMLSMRIAQKGYRIAYTPDAFAVEYGSLNMEEEGKRKRRIFWLQCLFYICAVLGYATKDDPNSYKVFYIPYYFLFMNMNVIRGIYYLFNRGFIGGWEKSQRK